MTPERIGIWLEQAGLSSSVIAPMAAGMGVSALWRVTRKRGDLVVRLFPATDRAVRDREVMAMRTARSRGLPVPEVTAHGEIDESPVLVTPFVPGETVADALTRDPSHAAALGTALGRTLAALNAITAPAGLADPDVWIHRAGPALAPLHGIMRTMPASDRLLHLDFHPLNVLVVAGEVSGIIDWTNTLPGPPHIDLGRSLALLDVIRRLVRPEAEPAVTPLMTELEAEHRAVHGPDPHPALSRAWGLGMLARDVAPHTGAEDSWVTPEAMMWLEAERDAAVADALADA